MKLKAQSQQSQKCDSRSRTYIIHDTETLKPFQTKLFLNNHCGLLHLLWVLSLEITGEKAFNRSKIIEKFYFHVINSLFISPLAQNALKSLGQVKHKSALPPDKRRAFHLRGKYMTF